MQAKVWNEARWRNSLMLAVGAEASVEGIASNRQSPIANDTTVLTSRHG